MKSKHKDDPIPQRNEHKDGSRGRAASPPAPSCLGALDGVGGSAGEAAGESSRRRRKGEEAAAASREVSRFGLWPFSFRWAWVFFVTGWAWVWLELGLTKRHLYLTKIPLKILTKIVENKKMYIY
jgi:hypothetical protein